MSESLQNHLERRPLHEQVAKVLRTEVLAGAKPGQRLEAESKLAKRLGVAVHTLRQALSIVEHEGLVDRRHGKGTFVADPAGKHFVALVTNLCSTVGESDFQARVLRLVDEILRQQGYATRFFVQPEILDESAWDGFRENVSNGRIIGALFVAMNPGDLVDALKQKGVPYVFMADEQMHTVRVDYFGMVRDGTRHLLERGCRKIALMRWAEATPEEPNPRYLAAYRALEETNARYLATFRALLAAHGASTREEWLRTSVPPTTPGAGWEQFRAIWASGKTKPDGLLVLDDILFRDVALGILDTGVRVPDQLQVVIHANKGSGLAYPFPVSRLEIDPNEHAEAMAELLIKQMRKEKAGDTSLDIHARLIPAEARETVAREARAILP